MIFFKKNTIRNTAILLLFAQLVFGQAEKKDALKGNSSYDTGIEFLDLANLALNSGDSIKYNDLNKKADKHFLDAEVNYKKALQKNQDFLKADFNLGDALYKQGRYDEAVDKFEKIIEKSDNNIVKGGSHHNIGNAHLQNFFKNPQENQGKLDESIESFKNALRNNPRDNEARYNLEMAKRLKQQMQQQQQQQNQDQQNQDQQNQDKKDQQKQENKENEDQKKKEQQKQEQQNKDKKDKEDEKQQQPKEGEMSKEEAERLLEALKNEEDKLQEKLKKKKVKGGKRYIEKDW
ncbi:MAG: tetratricopeptide repeat protein [Saprospiraceae bacterium]|nr:tetratricopeptide repeat protein [Saprospiraceae bacterium]